MNNSKDINRNINSVCAVIPFYNEKNTLKIIIDAALKYVSYIIAVNDGSNDDSYEEERNIPSVKIVDLDKNYGKGKALSIGFQEAISAGFNNVVTIDADLQHKPNHIPDLIEALNSYDIVIGNRLKNLKEMPLQRRLSNTLTSFLLTIKTGQHIIDSQCGFRAYRIEVLERVKANRLGFEAESEILVKAARKGFQIGFVDIPTIYGNEKSKMRPFEAIIGFLKVLFSRIES